MDADVITIKTSRFRAVAGRLKSLIIRKIDMTFAKRTERRMIEAHWKAAKRIPGILRSLVYKTRGWRSPREHGFEQRRICRG